MPPADWRWSWRTLCSPAKQKSHLVCVFFASRMHFDCPIFFVSNENWDNVMCAFPDEALATMRKRKLRVNCPEGISNGNHEIDWIHKWCTCYRHREHFIYFKLIVTNWRVNTYGDLAVRRLRRLPGDNHRGWAERAHFHFARCTFHFCGWLNKCIWLYKIFKHNVCRMKTYRNGKTNNWTTERRKQLQTTICSLIRKKYKRLV